MASLLCGLEEEHWPAPLLTGTPNRMTEAWVTLSKVSPYSVYLHECPALSWDYGRDDKGQEKLLGWAAAAQHPENQSDPTEG